MASKDKSHDQVKSNEQRMQRAPLPCPLAPFTVASSFVALLCYGPKPTISSYKLQQYILYYGWILVVNCSLVWKVIIENTVYIVKPQSVNLSVYFVKPASWRERDGCVRRRRLHSSRPDLRSHLRSTPLHHCMHGRAAHRVRRRR